jgi:tRNA (adenine58-N1)-methyltransferase non-catalytic subunit
LALDALEQVREELFSGEWDGSVLSFLYMVKRSLMYEDRLLIATQYEPFSIVQRITPYLAGSSTITIYSQHLPVLAEVHSKMRTLPAYLSPSITEAWLRQYQVLPGRTHPMMNMTGGGGYILHAIHVYDDPKASSALTGFRKRISERKMREAKLGGRTVGGHAETIEESTSILDTTEDTAME